MNESFLRTEEFIINRMSRFKVPAISIALLKEGKVTYKRGFGFKDLEKGVPASPSTLYGIGSITKSFTALSIMQLFEKGLLDLHDPVGKYLPIKLISSGKEVTIHHLLTHSSGIPSLSYAEALFEGFLGIGDEWFPASSSSDVLTLARKMSEWSVTKPGRKFFYLNTGYVLLGKIIEALSGLSYEDFIKENILKKLGMSKSSFYREELIKDPDLAAGYALINGKHARKPFPYGVTADGGLFSNVLELSKYLMMYLRRGEGVVSEDSIRAMETPYIDVPWQLFGGEGYGYGLIIHPNFIGRKLVEHSGSVLIYTGFIGYLPDEGIAVAVLENSPLYPPSYIGMYALAEALGENPNKSLPFLIREDILKKVEGVYKGFMELTKVSVKASGDFLIVESVEGSKQILVPEEVGEDFVKCFTFSEGVKLPVEFIIEREKVELFLGRYRYVKKAV